MKKLLRSLIKEKGFINKDGVRSFRIMEFQQDVLAMSSRMFSHRTDNGSFTMSEAFLMAEALDVTIQELITNPSEVRNSRDEKRKGLTKEKKTKIVKLDPEMEVDTKPKSRQQLAKERYERARQS